MPPTEGSLRREGEALVFAGALDRVAAASLWTAATRALAGAQRIVLTDVTFVDSAGLALLSALATRLRGTGIEPRIEGEPAGLLELRTAYRLTPGLGFPAASSS